MPRLAVIGIYNMTRGAARMAIIARLIIRAHEPHKWIVEPRFVDVENGDGNTQTGSRTAIGLLDIGSPRFFQPLYTASRVG